MVPKFSLSENCSIDEQTTNTWSHQCCVTNQKWDVYRQNLILNQARASVWILNKFAYKPSLRRSSVLSPICTNTNKSSQTEYLYASMLLQETTLQGCSCNANLLYSEHLNEMHIWWPQIHLSMSYLLLVVKHRHEATTYS